MHLYTQGALVILFLLIVAFGIRVLRGLRTNTNTTYKAGLVFLFIMLIAGTVWQLFQSHIL